jgi:hypothetical protein
LDCVVCVVRGVRCFGCGVRGVRCFGCGVLWAGVAVDGVAVDGVACCAFMLRVEWCTLGSPV